MIEHELCLDYRLAPGWLGPFVSGIADGRAVGHRCDGCGRVSFVPLRTCDCGHRSGAWLELPGTATVVTRTTGADGDFGLVRFDGADTQTIARLDGFAVGQSRGVLASPPSALPAIVLRPHLEHVSE